MNTNTQNQLHKNMCIYNSKQRESKNLENCIKMLIFS